MTKERQKCVCCGYYTLVGTEIEVAWEICPVCFWENDISGEIETEYSEANHMTLAEGKINFEQYGACEERFVKNCRKPQTDELPEQYEEELR